MEQDKRQSTNREIVLKIAKADYGQFLQVRMKDGEIRISVSPTTGMGYNCKIETEGDWSLPILEE